MKVYLNESKSDFDNPLLTTDKRQSSLSIVWIFAYLSILSSRPATMSLMEEHVTPPLPDFQLGPDAPGKAVGEIAAE